MQFRAVLAGCGGMSRGWLEAIQSAPEIGGRVQIVGLVDIDRSLAEKRASEFNLPGVVIGTDVAEVLDRTSPDLLFDVVIPGARQSVVIAGLERGCHVLSEKPMATSLEDARRLVELARRAGKVHAVVQNRRFNEGTRRIRATLESGVLGELTALHCDFFVGAHFGGFREEMQNVLLIDMAIHTFDAARFMSAKTPQAVYCYQNNPKGSWYAHGAAANAIFELSDGVVFNYRGSWSAEGANTSWDSSWRVLGTKGTLLWDGEAGFEAKVVAGTEGFFRPLAPIEVAPPANPAQTRGHPSVIADFLHAIETGTQPETSSEDNIKSLGMVFAAVESARTGRRVNIEA